MEKPAVILLKRLLQGHNVFEDVRLKSQSSQRRQEPAVPWGWNKVIMLLDTDFVGLKEFGEQTILTKYSLTNIKPGNPSNC